MRTIIRVIQDTLLPDHSLALVTAKAFVSESGVVLLDAHLLSPVPALNDHRRPSHHRFPVVFALGHLLARGNISGQNSNKSFFFVC